MCHCKKFFSNSIGKLFLPIAIHKINIFAHTDLILANVIIIIITTTTIGYKVISVWLA